MKYHHYTIDKILPFLHVDLDVLATCEYGDGYLDLIKLEVWSTRRAEFIEASDRLTEKFKESHWDYLYNKCLDHSRDEAEYYKDQIKERVNEANLVKRRVGVMG